MITNPQIVQTSIQITAMIRITVPRAEIQQVMGPGYQELMAAVSAQGITPVGPWFNHHLRMEPDIFDFELGVPVTSPISPTGRVEIGELPAGLVARTVYQGPFEGLGAAWEDFESWIVSEGHIPAPDLWECYLVGPESSSNPADWRTELNRPLARSNNTFDA